MCGIFGWDLRGSGVGSKQRLVLAVLLGMGNDSRGGDSWGFLQPLNYTAERGLDYILPHAYKMARHEVVGGHTRKATTGASTVENAHPYDFGRVIGAHNGMIYNHSELKKKNEVNFEVDSMHIFHALSQGKDLSGLEGYGAIWWVDKEDPGKIFLCKLSASADLSIFGVGEHGKDDDKGVIWSSDESHVKKALMGSGISGFFYKIEQNKVYYIEDGRLLVSDRELKLDMAYRRSSNDYSHWPTRYNGYSDGTHTESNPGYGDIRVKDGKVQVHAGGFSSGTGSLYGWQDYDDFIECYPRAGASQDAEELMSYADYGLIDFKEDVFIPNDYRTEIWDRFMDAMANVAEKEKIKKTIGKIDKDKKTNLVKLFREKKKQQQDGAKSKSSESKSSFPTQEEFEKMDDDQQMEFLESLNIPSSQEAKQ